MYIISIRMTTKRIRNSPILEALFTSQARIAILELFLLRSSRRHYLREIATLTELPIRAVQREVARLSEGGILRSEREGNRKYFAVDRGNPVFLELRALFMKTAGFAQVLQRALAEHAPEVRLALLFGSYAGGSETHESDIDLLVVGNLTSRELSKLLAPAKEALGREINPVLMTAEEFKGKRAAHNPFLENVLKGQKILIAGDESELGELASVGAD